MTEGARRRGLAGELARKAVHVGMGGFALSFRWLTPWQAALFAVVALAFNLIGLHRITGGFLLRPRERASGYSMGIVLYPAVVLALVLVFRERLELAAAAWGLLAFGDGMATVAGRLLGGPRLPWSREKTWAGLAAFVVWGTAASAFLLRWTQRAVLESAQGEGGTPSWIGPSFLGGVPGDSAIPATLILFAGCLVAALAAGFAETLDTGLDDNIVVPLVGGATLFLGTLVEPARLVAMGDALVPALLLGAAINGALAVAALAARGVSWSGAIWGWLLGTALFTFGGWRGFLMLVVFFALGTASTRLGHARKESLGIAQERGGRRGARNAFANTTTGVVCAFLAMATPLGPWFAVALVAAFATAACDTVSSEIGQAYGRRHVLVTSFRRVPAGTDGAVSLEGTAAGIFAAAVVAGLAWTIGLIGPVASVVVTAAAFAGATAESYVGAIAGPSRKIDNEVVNFANTVVGALVACGLLVLIGVSA